MDPGVNTRRLWLEMARDHVKVQVFCNSGVEPSVFLEAFLIIIRMSRIIVLMLSTWITDDPHLLRFQAASGCSGLIPHSIPRAAIFIMISLRIADKLTEI
jgi:hypothetical protein